MYGEEYEEDHDPWDPGFAHICMADTNFGEDTKLKVEKEWVCNSGAYHHMSGDSSFFDSL